MRKRDRLLSVAIGTAMLSMLALTYGVYILAVIITGVTSEIMRIIK